MTIKFEIQVPAMIRVWLKHRLGKEIKPGDVRHNLDEVITAYVQDLRYEYENRRVRP